MSSCDEDCLGKNYVRQNNVSLMDDFARMLCHDERLGQNTVT